MSSSLIASLGFLALFALMLLRVPIGVAMGLVGVIGYGYVRGFNRAWILLEIHPVAIITNFNLILIPLFILMGVFAANSGLSREIFRAAEAWLSRFRGGLGITTIVACGGFSAICGSSVATASTMTKIALPEMRRAGYPDYISTGIIAGGGTLGILIPPSTVMIIYGFITETEITRLFMAGIIPGLISIVLYSILIMVLYRKSLPPGKPFDLKHALASLSGVWATALVFLSIIGAMYFGLASPVEASAMGATLILLVGVIRRKLPFRLILSSMVESLRTSVGVYTVLIGAVLFGYFLTITQTPQSIAEFLVGLDMGKLGTLILILLLFIVAGMFLDTLAMILILVPIVYPVIAALGYDLVWFGIIVVIVAEIGLTTPPIGINVFIINAIAKDVKLQTIFRGVLPFVAMDIAKLALFIALPALVMFLPNTMN